MLQVISIRVLIILKSWNAEIFNNCNPRGKFTVLLSTFIMTSFVSL